MTKEEIIKELEEIRLNMLDELTKLNARHDALIQYLAELNILIDKTKENDNA